MKIIKKRAKKAVKSLFLKAIHHSKRLNRIAFGANLLLVMRRYGIDTPGSLILDGKDGLGNLYLGRIPMQNKIHNDQYIIMQNAENARKPLGLVVTVLRLDEEENADGSEKINELDPSMLYFGYKQVSPQEWKDQNVDFHHVRATDFKADMDFNDVTKAINIMDNQIRAGKSVYVHCKAGHGRSVLVAAAYLLTKQGYTLDQTMARMRIARPGLKFAPFHIKYLVDYIEYIDKKNSDENPQATKLRPHTMKYSKEYSAPAPEFIAAWNNASGSDLEKARQLLANYARKKPYNHKEIKRLLNERNFQTIKNVDDLVIHLKAQTLHRKIPELTRLISFFSYTTSKIEQPGSRKSFEYDGSAFQLSV